MRFVYCATMNQSNTNSTIGKYLAECLFVTTLVHYEQPAAAAWTLACMLDALCTPMHRSRKFIHTNSW